MTTEQQQALARLATDLDALHAQAVTMIQIVQAPWMRSIVPADTRTLIAEAEFRLDTAAENVARLAKEATNG
jgi:hypothetical protein